MQPLMVAGKKGAVVMAGRERAIHQAADASKLFTGPSMTVTRDAFDGAMRAKGCSAPHTLRSIDVDLAGAL